MRVTDSHVIFQETTDSESVGASLQACSILLPQFAWDVAARTLGADDLSQNIIPSLQQLVDTLSAEIAAGLSNGEEVAHVLIKVCLITLSVPCKCFSQVHAISETCVLSPCMLNHL